MLLLHALPALALTPPPGWTPLADGRAMLDPVRPGAGELREIAVTGGTGDPDELVLALRAQGLAPASVTPDGQGKVNLVFADRIGRATHRVEGPRATWVVVLAEPAAATALDPDALLAIAMPPRSAGWDGALALGGGHDGVWGAAATTSDGWVQSATGAAWSLDPALVGAWTGTALVRGSAMRVRMRFENTGVVRVERSFRGETTVDEGAWATRETFVRMEVPGGGEFLAYRVLGASATLDFADTTVTLHRDEEVAPPKKGRR